MVGVWRSRQLFLAVAVAGLLTLTSASSPAAGAPRRAASASPVPPGFAHTVLASGLANPTVLAFAPGGDLYIGEQAGTVLIFRNGHVLSPPVVTLPTDSRSEMGLLGLALDPSFASNGYMYVSYTTVDHHARVSRLTVVNGRASLSSERIVLTGTQLQTGFASANDLQVGPDGMLWWSVGDAAPEVANAHTLTTVNGKILRFNRDGSIPSDNPFLTIPGAVPAIYAYGLRNPFRFTFLPDGRPMAEDTGSSYWEEMNVIQRGGNYGWNFFEGDCSSCGYINPVYAYGHLPTDGAASAIAAYAGTRFPVAYRHVVFFGDYNRRDIEAVTFDSTYRTEVSDTVFDTSAGSIADLREGPDGNLYFVSIFDGTLTEISAPGPFPPTAVAAASPSAGPTPLSVQFSSAGSADAFGGPLGYSWNFGDGSPLSSSAAPTHIYAHSGHFTATLTVTSGTLTAQATAAVVAGTSPPMATIASPAASTTYGGGETVSFSGSATDPTDGKLPPAKLTWQVDFIRDGVTVPFYVAEVPHPFSGPITGVDHGSFVVPTGLANVPGSFYRITLTAVDSQGLTDTVVRDIHPALTSWKVTSNVAGAAVVIDGALQTATMTVPDVVGTTHFLTALPTQVIGGIRYRFLGWSDGSALVDRFSSSPTAATFTALFEPVQTGVTAPWSSVDVGNPAAIGGVDVGAQSHTFNIDGGGIDTWGSVDQSHYVYRSLSGDGVITARIRYQTETDPWTKAGLMVRQSAVAGSSYVDVLTTPDVSPNTPDINGVGCVFPANAPGAGCEAPLPPIIPTFGHGIRMQYHPQGEVGVTTPAAGFLSPNKWLRLQRSGNVFASSYSTDGSHWISVGSTTLAMSAQVTVGLFVTSHDSLQTSAVAFDNIVVG